MLADFVGGPMHGQSKFVPETPRVLRFSKFPDVQVNWLDREHAKPDLEVIEYQLIHVTETFCVYFIDRDPRYMPPMSLVEHFINKEWQFEMELCSNLAPRDSILCAESFALSQMASRKLWERAVKRLRKLKRRP